MWIHLNQSSNLPCQWLAQAWAHAHLWWDSTACKSDWPLLEKNVLSNNHKHTHKIHEKKLSFCLLTYLYNKDVTTGSVAAVLQWWGDEPECESQHAKDGKAERLKEPRSFLRCWPTNQSQNYSTSGLLIILDNKPNTVQVTLGGSLIIGDQNQPR